MPLAGVALVERRRPTQRRSRRAAPFTGAGLDRTDAQPRPRRIGQWPHGGPPCPRQPEDPLARQPVDPVQTGSRRSAGTRDVHQGLRQRRDLCQLRRNPLRPARGRSLCRCRMTLSEVQPKVCRVQAWASQTAIDECRQDWYKWRVTEPLVPRPGGHVASKPGRWTRQSAGGMFAALAAFLITRDATFGFFRHTWPDRAYTATVLTGLAVSAVAYGLAVSWLRRLP